MKEIITVCPPSIKLNWTICEEIGTVIVNDYAVSKIDVGNGGPSPISETYEYIYYPDIEQVMTPKTPYRAVSPAIKWSTHKIHWETYQDIMADMLIPVSATLKYFYYPELEL